MTESYSVSWQCNSCDHANEAPLTKTQAAFFDSPGLELPALRCSECGGFGFKTMGYQQPEIDKELLETWMRNPDFCFLSQDEELLIARVDTDALIDAYEACPTEYGKHFVILSAMLVRLTDHLTESPREKQTLANYLLERRAIWEDDDYYWDYIIARAKVILQI